MYRLSFREADLEGGGWIEGPPQGQEGPAMRPGPLLVGLLGPFFGPPDTLPSYSWASGGATAVTAAANSSYAIGSIPLN